MSTEDFIKAKKGNAFCVTWEAHGLHYGVQQAAVDLVETGHLVVLNGARRALSDLRNTFTNMVVINITADPDVLAMRLVERGREDAAKISDRLKQQSFSVDPDFDFINIDNSGSLATAAADLKIVLKNLTETQTLQSLAG